jgi:hypothetical protein
MAGKVGHGTYQHQPPATGTATSLRRSQGSVQGGS